VSGDIDAQIRSAPWDVGADELSGTTAVKLMSFAATAADSSVALEWWTGSELDNLGFHLYRGPSADGPWTRLTSSLIPGPGSSPLGQAYSWLDTGLTNGTRYYYRLEDVDTASKSTFHGPVSAVPAPASSPQAKTVKVVGVEATRNAKNPVSPLTHRGSSRPLRKSSLPRALVTETQSLSLSTS
jgi:hypothetical protein